MVGSFWEVRFGRFGLGGLILGYEATDSLTREDSLNGLDTFKQKMMTTKECLANIKYMWEVPFGRVGFEGLVLEVRFGRFILGALVWEARFGSFGLEGSVWDVRF